jgi:hypothetical protein
VSHRFQIVLPDPVAGELRHLAAGSGEAPSTVASQLVRAGVRDAGPQGRVRMLRAVPDAPGGSATAPPRWLEPYGGDPAWRRQMWGAIVALHARYPRLLEALKDGWWTDEAHTETLCALAVWRNDLDDAGESPREELAFQRELADYAQVLRRQCGGVANLWSPGAPPPEWSPG